MTDRITKMDEFMAGRRCPSCKHQGHIVAVEYSVTDRFYYDGISELECRTCGRRWGRWCGCTLHGDMAEPPHCKLTKSEEHPIRYKTITEREAQAHGGSLRRRKRVKVEEDEDEEGGE